MLSIQHLEKRFGEKVLFRDLCLTVDAPAVLWAPSGWGKTTLLRILMGLEAPTGGTVEGVGRVGAVFQEDRLCPQLTAVQNVALVLPGDEIRYEQDIIRDFQRLGMNLSELALPAGRLSGGQKRRTALLRALWAPADTLLLDEPFTGMDPETLGAHSTAGPSTVRQRSRKSVFSPNCFVRCSMVSIAAPPRSRRGSRSPEAAGTAFQTRR